MKRADLVLAGGGVKGIGHVGAIAALEEDGYAFQRIAGTSAGSIVGALAAAGMPAQRMRKLLQDIEWRKLRDRDHLRDMVPLAGPALSVALELGVYEGAYIREWLGNQLADVGVQTFKDLRIEDPGGSLAPDQGFRLVVMAADLTRGELVRLPWDYRDRYGLDPDEQLVVDAVRASMSIPLYFEPVTLRHADGSKSLLVDGGVLSNYPLDAFDRTDAQAPRWPTFGVTLLPPLPAGNAQLFPQLGPLRRGLVRFLESLVTTMIVGRDQGYLSQPWVQARSIAVDTSAVGVVDFEADRKAQQGVYRSGRRAAERFLAGWDWEEYLQRFRPAAVGAATT